MSRQTLISFQPAEFVDHITEDGTELTKLPYPIHAWADNGEIPPLAGGTPGRRILGFMRDPAVQRIDASWATIAYNPTDAVGMYVVYQQKDGTVSNLTTAVRDVTVREGLERPDTISGALDAPVDSERRREGWL